MNELLNLRTENSKTYGLGMGKHQCVISIGAIHYKDNYADKSEAWKDIDLTIRDGKLTTAPYELVIEGNKITVKDKKTGDISTIELTSVKPDGLKFEIVPDNTRVSFRHILPSDKIPFEAQFKVSGKNIKTRAFDDGGELELEASLIDGVLTEKLSQVKDKQSGLVRPAKGSIKVDPTWQVGASADDCKVNWAPASSAWEYSHTAVNQVAGDAGATAEKFGGGMRFLNLAIPFGATITAAKLTFTAYATVSATTVNSVIIGEKSITPATFSALADYQARRGTVVGGANDNNITSASVAWNSIGTWTGESEYDSPEIKTIIQEIIDIAGWTSGASDLVLFWDDHAGNSSDAAYRHGYAYDGSSAKAPELTVTYTENKIVTPTTLALAITTYAPTVTTTNNILVTPTTLALTITTYAPTVSTPRLVTPSTLSLALTTYAPTVTTNNNILVTPTTLSLVITTFAPTITAPTLEYSACAPLKVMSQSLSSDPSGLLCYLTMVGIPNQMEDDKASKKYNHHKSDTKTVKDMITEIMDGQPVASELTEEQTESDDYIDLDGTQDDPLDAVGQRVSVPDRLITKVAFRLKKTGSPTGTNVTFVIRMVEAPQTILASKTFPIASITTSPTWCEATLTTPVQVDEEITWAGNTPTGGVWIYCEYTDGDASNYVSVSYNSFGVKANEWGLYVHSVAGADDLGHTDEDCAVRYKYTAAGIDCFDHCTAYVVVYDSEDSLIDTYLPKDAFRIQKNDNRLSVINRLLDYTGCVKRFEDDGKMHIFVPVTTGTTYDYEYSLATADHKFFSKSQREALVIPNRYVVSSYEDDSPQYTGSATSAASYALLPKSEFVSRKLVSDAQATAIATALIGQAERAASRGSASVPINVGAEVWDYVKVTDSRQSDSRTGNMGVIRRSYNPNTNTWNMPFSFGKGVRKAIPGVAPSAFEEVMPEEIADANAVVRWGGFSDYMVKFQEKVWQGSGDGSIIGINDLSKALLLTTVPNLLEILKFVETLGYEWPKLDDTIATALLGYIKRLQDDPSPKLGANLDVNGHSIRDIVNGVQLSAGNKAVYITAGGDIKTFDTDGNLDMGANKVIGLSAPTVGSTDAARAAELVAVTVSQTARALDTIYQNTTTKLLVQTITFVLADGDQVSFQMDSTTAPTTVRGRVSLGGATSARIPFTFIVPVNWYFRFAIVAGAPTVSTYSDEQLH